MTEATEDLPTIDLSECENEPVHQLELVQSHGAVLVTDGPDLTVQFASRNADAFLGETADSLLDRPLAEVLDPLAVAALEPLLADPSASGHEDTPARLGVHARPTRRGSGIPARLRVTAHRVARAGQATDRIILDLESVPDDDEDAAEATAEAESIAMADLRDAGALRHGVSTLVTSALRANPPHGTVMVHLTLDQSGEPRLSVRDSGLGLTEDDMMALRQPMDDPGGDSERGGATRGLSLALVRGLIDLHGGAVSVSSNPSMGTSVDITLPRHRVVGHDNDPPSPRRR